MTNFWMTHLYWTIVASAEKAEKLREGADIKLKISEPRDYRIYRNGLSVYLEEWELSDVLVDLGRFSLVDDNLWLIVKLWFIKPDDYGLLLYSSLMRDALQKDTKTDFGFTPTSTPTHLSLNHIGAISHFISFCDAYPCTLIRKPVKAFLPIVPVLVRFRIFQKSKNNISILWKIWRNMLK